MGKTSITDPVKPFDVCKLRYKQFINLYNSLNIDKKIIKRGTVVNLKHAVLTKIPWMSMLNKDAKGMEYNLPTFSRRHREHDSAIVASITWSPGQFFSNSSMGEDDDEDTEKDEESFPKTSSHDIETPQTKPMITHKALHKYNYIINHIIILHNFFINPKKWSISSFFRDLIYICFYSQISITC